MKATYKGTVIADSDDTVIVDGNHYFPRASLHEEFFAPSDHTSVCGYKGTANYLHVVIDGSSNDNAAWFYADPKPGVAQIKDRVAFWRGVLVTG